MRSTQTTNHSPRERTVTMLAITFEQRRQLRALLDRVLDDVRADKHSYRVGCPGEPEFGRLIRDGVDITELTFETERLALEFRRML